jgi:hypothetical protein
MGAVMYLALILYARQFLTLKECLPLPPSSKFFQPPGLTFASVLHKAGLPRFQGQQRPFPSPTTRWAVPKYPVHTYSLFFLSLQRTCRLGPKLLVPDCNSIR